MVNIGFSEDTRNNMMEYVDKLKNTSKKTLGDALMEEIIQKIIHGDCRMSGVVTDHKTKDMFVRFSFYEEEETIE